MQSLVGVLLLFPAKFPTPENFAKILIPPTPHPKFLLKFRPLPRKLRTNRPQNPPELGQYNVKKIVVQKLILI